MNVATLTLFFLIPLIFLLENVNDETYLKPISSGYHSLTKSQWRCLSRLFLPEKSLQFATRPGGFIILSDFAIYKSPP